MGTLSRLSKKCQECPFVDKCKNKRMEAEAYAMSVTMPSVAELIHPMTVKHSLRDVEIAENTTITIDLEELKEQLKRSHSLRLEINYGA